jgi:DNA polymerase III subunit epsilon
MEMLCIDFETANSSRGSVCSLGVAVFSGGTLKESTEWLVRPHRSLDYFDPFNVSIHGISSKDVRKAPEFDEVMPQLLARLKPGMMTLAHNAAFDISVLRSVLDLYRIPYPEFDYLCTCKAAQKVWPDMADHKLDSVCARIKHRFNHHNAKADAEAAGLALLAMIGEVKAESTRDFATRIGLKTGRLLKDGYKPCSAAKPPRQKRQA